VGEARLPRVGWRSQLIAMRGKDYFGARKQALCAAGASVSSGSNGEDKPGR
jgi:hypothetical protein